MSDREAGPAGPVVSGQNVLKIRPTCTAAEAARRMRQHRVGSLVVVEDGDRLAGIVTERDLIDRVLADSGDPQRLRVADVMTPDVVSVPPAAPASTVSRLMAVRRIRHLPVVDDGRVVGIISARDVVARQLRLAQALKAAAEKVALLSKSLRRLDVGELVEMLSTQVPDAFAAHRWVLYLADEDPGAPGTPAVHRIDCPCDARDLARRADTVVGARHRSILSETVPPECRRFGCGGCQAIIPLDEAGLNRNGRRAPHARRSYLCMCGLPPLTEDSAEVLRYKLELIADILTVNLVNAKLYRAAYHDPLTALRTRRGMEETLAEEHTRARRHGRAFCVAMLDVDAFKLVNDEHGHATGDEILRTLADVLRSNVRTYDLIARHGGDEFAVLMPETQLDSAVVVAERLRRCTEQQVRTPTGRAITISCGVAQWSGPDEPAASAVLHRADAALYEAKRSGRNHVVAAPTPTPDEARASA